MVVTALSLIGAQKLAYLCPWVKTRMFAALTFLRPLGHFAFETCAD